MAVSDADILGWLNANPNADDKLIATTMREAGVSPERMAQVTNTDVGNIQSRYDAALTPTTSAAAAQQQTSAPVTKAATTAATTTAAKTTPAKVTDADILGWFNANPDADAAAMSKAMQDAKVSGTQVSNALKASPAAAQKYLTAQILSQGLTSKWQGEGLGSPEKNAANMAKILADTGITDIKQLGEVALTQPVQEAGKQYNGQLVRPQYDENGEYTGKQVYYKDTGQTDEDGNPIKSLVEVPKDAKLTTIYGVPDNEGGLATVDPSKIIKDASGNLVVDTGLKTFGNKLTGQAVANTYSERQTGNAFGGTFAGKGNTGYRVQFTPDGTPIFYTTGASSNDLANLMQDLGPIGNIALTAIGGPMAVAAVAALSGKSPKDILKSTALSYLGSQAGSFVSGTEGITDLLGETGTNLAANAAKQYVGSGGKGINPLGLVLGSGVTNGLFDNGTTGPNSADFEEGYFNPGGEGYNILNSDTTDDFLKSIGINSVDELTDSGLSNADILNLVTGGYGDLTGLEDFVTSGDGTDVTGNEVTGDGTDDTSGGLDGLSGLSKLSALTGTNGGSKTATTTNNGTQTTATPTKVVPTKTTPKTIYDDFGGTDTDSISATPVTKKVTTSTSPKISNVAKTVAGLVSGVKAAKTAAPTAVKTAVASASPAVDTIASQAQQQQNQQTNLLNLLGSSKDELANIKSYKDLYGHDLFGDNYVPPSAGGAEAQGAEEEFFNGGHVDDLSVDALLHILRN